MRHTTTGFVDSERTENGTNTPGESVTLKNGPSKDCKVVESHVSEHIEHVEEDELSDKTITGCHKSPTCSPALGNLLQSFEYIFISLPNA